MYFDAAKSTCVDLYSLENSTRFSYAQVTLASLNGNEAVQCSRKVRIVPDASLAEAMKSAPYDAIVLPGGMPNAKTLAAVGFHFPR